MTVWTTIVQWILGILLVISSLGIILLAKKPVQSSLSFLLTLFLLAIFYLQLSAQFIAVMQVLVYAGAILVIFMFVIVLFQDAHQKIAETEAISAPPWLFVTAAAFCVMVIFLGKQFIHLPQIKEAAPEEFGTVQSLGQSLYVDFFFPFEAVIMLFLVAVVGTLYIAKKVNL
jgi:NADH-quinone oxidoreductase subunit J